jgi:hypothetical protein
MKGLARIVCTGALCLAAAGAARAELADWANNLPVDIGEMRTVTLDSLYFHGDGGTGDNSIIAGETVSVTAVLPAGASWFGTPPSQFDVIENSQNPPTLGGAGTSHTVTTSGSSVSGTRVTFNFTAPDWDNANATFTVQFTGIQMTPGFDVVQGEGYVATGAYPVIHSGTQTLTGVGFSYGDMEFDTTEPTMVDASCWATALNTVRIVMSEDVSESGGDTGASFALTGGGISGSIAGTSLTQTSGTLWTLELASNLPNRYWTGTITYDRDAQAAMLVDGAGNEVPDGETAVTTTERIPPANPTMTLPVSTTDLSGGTVNWTGTADAFATDNSMASVALQGSTDGTSWAALNTDSNTADSNYSGSWTIGTEYNYYRLLATDTNGQSTASSMSTDFQQKQRLVLAGTVDQEINTYEDQITVTIHDAYGNAETGTHTVSLTKTSGSGTVTFRETPAGSNTSVVDIDGATNATFYMASTLVGTHEIRAATAGLVADTLSCTISSGAASKILVKLPGQSFVDGTGITGTPTTWNAGGGIDFYLYIVDASNFLVTETSTRTIDFSSTASNSLRNFAPRIDGVISTGWTGRSIDFTNGVSELLTAIIYDANGGTITADDPDGTPALTGTESTLQTIRPREPDYLVFSLNASTSESTVAWTGTNTVTVRDFYGNVDTDFDASAYNVTVTSSGGTLEIASRGDAILDQVADFSTGVADLTTLGITLTASTGTYTIDGTIAGVTMDAPNGTGSKEIVVNTPTLTNADPAWRTHVNCEAGNPGLALYADVDEDGETLTVYWAFDNDSTKYSGYSVQSSSNVTTNSGLIFKYLNSTQMQAGDGYDYMFWWVGGTDAEGNAPEGKPISSNRMIYLVNPTLTVTGIDVGSGMEPSSTNNSMTQLQLTAEQPGAEIVINRIDFSKTSSSNATSTHVSGFKLWRDVNGNGVYDSGTDTQIGSTVTGTVNPSFTGLNETVINGTTTNLLLTVDISASATTSQTLGMELTSDNVFVLQSTVDDVYPAGGDWPEPAAAGDYTLPVEISVFSAEADFGRNQLNWRTESEVNSLGFVVWRAPALEMGLEPAASSFSAIADWNLNPELEAQENSSAATDYDYSDTSVEPGQIYCYRIEAVDLDGSREFYEQSVFVESIDRPADFVLEGNVPNPFNPVTTISFLLPVDTDVELAIYNMMGQKVRTLLAGELAWGRHQVLWDGTNDAGQQVASGSYVYRLHSESFSQANKMILLK